MKIINILLVSLVLVACSTQSYQYYDGKRKPIDEVAFIVCDEKIGVKSVDGKGYPPGAAYFALSFDRCIIELDEGEHTIEYQATTGGGAVSLHTKYEKKTFDLKKGDIYKIYQKMCGAKWCVWVDKLEGSTYQQEKNYILSKRR